MRDEELAAPRDLEHLRRFVNTRDLELGTDLLASPDDLARWLGVDRAGDNEFRKAIALREAFRALLLSNATGAPPPVAASQTIEAVGRRSALRVDGELRLAASGLERLLAIAVIAQADGTWRRLKACPGESCQWALYDRTRSRTRTWCAAAKCGARTRSREYRRRQRT